MWRWYRGRPGSTCARFPPTSSRAFRNAREVIGEQGAKRERRTLGADRHLTGFRLLLERDRLALERSQDVDQQPRRQQHDARSLHIRLERRAKRDLGVGGGKLQPRVGGRNANAGERRNRPARSSGSSNDLKLREQYLPPTAHFHN